MTLQIERLRTIEQLKAFVAGSAPVDCKPLDRESAYDFVRRTLVAFDYHRQGKADRGCVRRYIVKVTGLSPAQLTRLVARHAETGAVVDLRARNSGRPFETRYRSIDIRLLAEVDEAFGQMSGLATCEILRRAFEVHGDPRFERLAGISRSHVEGKNAHVVRRHLGHEHIAARFADDVDAFARGHLSPFVNFHRPSLYATEYVDSKGKVRRKYLRDDVKTPYEKLKSLSGPTGHLKPGLTFGALDRIAGAQSDLEAARALNAARAELFRRIRSTAAAA